MKPRVFPIYSLICVCGKDKVNMQMQLDCAVSTDAQALSKDRGTEKTRAWMKGGLMKARVGCIMSHVQGRNKERFDQHLCIWLGQWPQLHSCLVDVMLHDLEKILPETEVRAHSPFEPTLCAPGFNSSSWPVSFPLLSILLLPLFSFLPFIRKILYYFSYYPNP